MTRGHIKTVFPGGNTSIGFHSFYDYLAYPKRNMIFVMKGGPGVGKSTFMRKIGDGLVERGFDVEYHNCSSDNGSLDGIYVAELGVAILDGTAPHVVDPKHPGAIDEIIHLGDYWNEDELRANREDVVAVFKENARLFRKAYGNLAVAKVYSDEVESYYSDSEALDFGALNTAGRQLVKSALGDGANSDSSMNRHLFASAISPKGIVNFLDTVVAKCDDIYVIKGDMGTGKSTLIRKLYDEASLRGYYVEAYHCALTPERLEHLVIPQLGVAVVTSAEAHRFAEDRAKWVIDTGEYVNDQALKPFVSDMARARELYKAALERAIECIGKAKANHDHLETFYIPHMDFHKVEARRREVLARILALADK